MAETRQARRARLRESCALVTAPRREPRAYRRAVSREMARQLEHPRCAGCGADVPSVGVRCEGCAA